MSSNSHPALDWAEINNFVTDLIKRAGQRVVADFGQVGHDFKARFDLVTKTDVETEAFLKEALHDRFPAHQLFAEEGGRSEPVDPARPIWVIDPVDGTVNFALDIPFFSISVALLQDGQPLMGWIYDPLREELFSGQQGGGSFLNGVRLAVGDTSESPLPIAASSDFIEQAIRSGRIDNWSALFDRFGRSRTLGSQALHMSYVAAGRLRAALSSRSRLWDDAAGAVIALEAGACYSDPAGQPILPVAADSPLWSGAPLASLTAGPATHQALVSMLGEG